MAEIKKFLNQEGVGTLWSLVAAELNKKASSTDMTAAIKVETDRAKAAEKDNADKIKLNTDAIAVLNGDSTKVGSVAYQIAAIVAGADAKFDTLKEIADWIASDTTGTADMQSDIATLEELVGDTAVATQITNAINAALKDGETDKYALAADLTALTTRVSTLETAGYQTATQVNDAIATKITALDLDNKYDAKGAADTALTSANTYTDTAFNNIKALTAEEIRTAVANATATPEA